MLISRSLIPPLLAVAFCASAVAQPTLVADLSGGEQTRNPYLRFNGSDDEQLLFWGEDEVNGRVLWITDGTEQGTRPWADVCPGNCRTFEPRSPLLNLGKEAPSREVVFDGITAFFVGLDPIHGQELWMSDGTAGGTRLVKDLCAGTCNADIRNLAMVEGRVYFTATSPTTGREPWTSDGTSEGTYRIDDFFPGSNDSMRREGPRVRFYPLDGGAAFLAKDPTFATEWWWTDGSMESTRRLTDLCPGNCAVGVSDLVIWRGSIYFTARTSFSEGTRVSFYRLSTTEEPEEIIRFCSGSGCGVNSPRVFISGDQLYLTSPGDLWQSDGTREGSRLVIRNLPGRLSGHWTLGNGTVLLNLERASSEPFRLYRVEGNNLAGPFPGIPTNSVILGNRLISLRGSSGNFELVSNDGFEVEVLDSHPGFVPVLSIIKVAENVFFNVVGDTGSELWRTDGTAGNASIFFGNRSVPMSSSPADLVSLPGRALLRARSGASQGADLLSTDGTPAGTEILRAGIDPSLGQAIRVQGRDEAFFRARQFDAPLQPLLTDGSAEGTRFVDSGQVDRTALREPTSFRDALYFVADVGDGQKLWRSDGDGSEIVIDIEPTWRNLHVGCGGLGGCGPPNAATPIYPRDLTVMGSGGEELLVFVARQEESGEEVWLSNGTAEGTRLLSDLRPGGNGSAPDDLTVVAGKLFFLADNGEGRALWVWAPESSAGSGEGDITRLGSVGDTVVASTQVQDRFVWFEQMDDSVTAFQSDGSAQGTQPYATWPGTMESGRELVRTIQRNLFDPDNVAAGDVPPEVVSLGDRIYFLHSEPATGVELWSTDLTAEGTGPIDLWPGPASSYPQQLHVIDNALYFSAADAEHGRELWRLHPEAPGPPQLLGDIAPGPASSTPSGMAKAGDAIVFSADDGIHGRELWSLPLVENPCVVDDTRQCLGNGRFSVSVRWRIPATGEEGVGKVLPGTADSAFFWFFSPENLELVVKVLDGTAVNDHHWFFYGALTNVEYWIDTEDHVTGITRTYHNPPFELCGDADIEAFPEPMEGDNFTFPLTDQPALKALGEKEGSCVTAGETLCLRDRFEVTVDWKTVDEEGVGTAIPLTSETGLFWFFDANNVELAVKVLDAEDFNGRFWVFYGALSNVEYTLRVRDSVTGVEKTYRNPAGNFCGNADTDAFVAP